MIGGACTGTLTEEDHKGWDDLIQLLKRGHKAVIKGWQEFCGKELPQYLKASLAAIDLEAIIAQLLYTKQHWEDLSDILPAMTMPCLLYGGESDEDYMKIKKCAETMPNATFVPLPGIDHYGTIERGDLVLPHITKFLAEVRV